MTYSKHYSSSIHTALKPCSFLVAQWMATTRPSTKRESTRVSSVPQWLDLLVMCTRYSQNECGSQNFNSVAKISEQVHKPESLLSLLSYESTW